jgi:LysM repeat protein
MKNFLGLVFIFFSLVAFAQVEDAEIQNVDGKRYYVHFVKAGNTLYGIHKLYNVSVEDIVLANPGVEKGINDGQRILVPLPGSAGLEENLFVHVVQKKETLYGISKKYDISAERIIKFNPEIKDGLKEGQEIKIPIKSESSPFGPEIKPVDSISSPSYKITFRDTLLVHTVQKGETMYSLSKRYMVTQFELMKINELRNDRIRPGDELLIPIKKENFERVKVREIETPFQNKVVDSFFLFKPKKDYNIALLMPLFLDQNEGFPQVISDMAAEYYMGAKMAIDSLEKLGLRAKVYTFDSKNDTNTVKGILQKPEFKKMDLIIGPFYGTSSEVVADFAKKNKIRMVCPFATNYSILKDNPMVYEAVTSDITLAKGLARYLAKELSSKQVILVKPKSDKDLLNYEAFRTTFLNQSLDSGKRKLIQTSLKDLPTFIGDSDQKHIVFLSTNKEDVIKFSNTLTKTISKPTPEEVIIYGTKDWLTFNELSGKFKNNFNFHFGSPFDLNYQYEPLKIVETQYREKHESDFSKMAIQGFDVTLYFCQSLLLQKLPVNGLMNQYHISQRGSGNGYENTQCYILGFSNYDLKKVAEIHE